MRKKNLKILLIEDTENDMLLIKRELIKGGIEITLTWVQTISEMKNALNNDKFELVISDFSLSKFDGFEVLRIFKEYCLDIPFILVSGVIDESIAVEVMKKGANDYIMKDKLKRLVPAIERELKESKIRFEHKKTVEALIRNERKFRKIFENIQDVYYKIDLQGIILEISPSVERYIDIKREDLLGRNIKDFLLEKSESKIMFKKIIKNNEIIDNEIILLINNNKIIHCSVNAFRLNYTEKKKFSIEGSLRDITERKSAEQALIKALNKAEESDRLKTAFLQNISHEIRTPLNVILGFSELLNDLVCTHEEIKEFTGYIKQSGNKLLDVVNNILDLSTIEANKFNIDSKSFSINSLVEDMYCKFYLIAQGKNISFNVNKDLSDIESNIKSDEVILKKILTNVLDNAFKFTQEGNIDFGYSVKQDKIIFFVKDTGVGIPKDMSKRIFDGFMQVDVSSTRRYEGAGIGLTISKGLVELLNGTIWIESDLGKGTSVFIKIPLIREKITNKSIVEADYVIQE